MSRQAQVNSFNDGLNKDLNPLLTPNTVMTDCLNGTIVTYNGNEFALQNDLGNYKFKYGSLSEGFVPVGIKEHANTLYIISYNPVEDLVEVGSFPSMKTIFKSDINTHGEKDSTVIELKEEWNNYSEIQSFSQLTMLSSFDEDYKLNPGDGYRLECGDKKDNEEESDVARMLELDKQSKWQHTGVFVMTENQKLYNIDAFVQLDVAHDTYTTDDWRSVKWDVPGWLALKVIPNVMSEFNCYITDLDYTPENDYIKTEATIKVQSIWDSNMYNRDFLIGKTSTGYYRRIIDYIQDHIGYIVKYNKKEYIHLPNAKDHGSKFNDIENNLTVYNDIYSTIHTNIQIETKEDTQVEITPFLYICTDEDDINNDKKIVYDQFKTVLSLEKREFNSKDVKFGENVFKYYIGKSELTMNFDVAAPIGSILEYNLRRYPASGDMVEVYPEFKKIQDLNYNGQNIITFKFSNDYSDRYDKFDKEDYYELDVYIHPENYIIKNSDKNSKDGSKLCFKTSKAVYASEVVNYYQKQYDNYDSDEFKLDAESFADAAQRVLVVNNPIKQLPYDRKEVYLDYEGNTGECSSSLIDGYFKGIDVTSQEESYYYNKTASASNGVRNIWKIENSLFDFPKDQNSNDPKIGRLWRGFNVDTAKITVYATSRNGSTINVNKDNNKYYIDVVSKSNVKFGTTMIPLSYPTDNQSITMYNDKNGFVTEVGRGSHKYKLNKIILHKKEYGNRNFEIGIYNPENELTAEVIDSTTIKMSYLGFEYDYYFDGNDWVTKPDNLYITTLFNNIKFIKSNESWGGNGLEDTTASRAIDNKITGPTLVLYFNNYNIEEDEQAYFGTEEWVNRYFGFETPNLGFKDDDSGDRVSIAIAIPQMDNSSEYYYYVMVPNIISTDKTEFVDMVKAAQYIANTMCSYFLMLDSIKYCKSTSTQKWYYPNAIVSESRVDALYLTNVSYLIQGVRYKYDGDFTELNKPLSDIIYEYNEDVNIKLVNNTKSVFDIIKESANVFNDEVYSKTESLRTFSSVNSREIYVDLRHYENADSLPIRVFLSDITMGKNNKFTIAGNYVSGYLRTSHGSNEPDNGYNLAKFYNYSPIYEV